MTPNSPRTPQDNRPAPANETEAQRQARVNSDRSGNDGLTPAQIADRDAARKDGRGWTDPRDGRTDPRS